MGAIASGGIRVLNEEVRRGLGITNEVIAKVAARELKELNRREASYRGDRPALDVAGRIGILVDDGLATGATMRAAIAALKGSRPSRIIVAVPVGAPTTCEELADVADEVICARSPEAMTAISVWYDDFTQTSDDEVRELLAKAAAETDAGSFATHGRRST
jgi:putative phosphoribosyl transferase